LINKIKVLIVDDSAFMRKSLSLMLGADPEIEVVGTARDGLDGLEKVKNLSPDIVTLDIEMPRMDGLTALKRIMKECPTTVLMISSLTTEGADATIRAMELGAVDFIAKGMSYVNVNIHTIKEDLLKKVKSIGKQNFLKKRLNRVQSVSKSLKPSAKSVEHSGELPSINYKAVALGISTGGPLSLQKIIPRFSPKIRIPIFIVQHMPPRFTKSLADRLNSMSQLQVKEAEEDEVIKGGTVYIAPGGMHMTLRSNGKFPHIKISDQPSNSLHKPSVDVMVNSIVQYYGRYALGVIMTGMGKDGLEGIKGLKKIGGYCLAQNEVTSVVYGMPKAVVDAGLADAVSPLEKIPDIINKVLT
jgi:two-component system chemotaxis response regulator CheB